ncbi:unnamed protein product [Arctogadus glacialis]
MRPGKHSPLESQPYTGDKTSAEPSGTYRPSPAMVLLPSSPPPPPPTTPLGTMSPGAPVYGNLYCYSPSFLRHSLSRHRSCLEDFRGAIGKPFHNRGGATVH